MPVTGPISDGTQTVILDASGQGYVRFIPQDCDWIVNSIRVTATISGSTPVARVYQGMSLTAANNLDGTSTGNDDTSTGIAYTIMAGEWLTIQWTGGTAGDSCTAIISGTRTIQNAGFTALKQGY